MAANHAITDPQHPTFAEMPVNATLPVDEALGPDAPESYRSSASDPGRPVREFEAICAKHSLACGAPEDLAPFLRALTDNKLLAMNFWSVVARLSDGRHGAALSQQQILAAIVQAVTGQSMDNAAPALQDQVNQAARMLAGEDVLTPGPSATQEPHPDSAPQQAPSARAEASPSGLHSGVTQLHLDTAEPGAGTPPETVAPIARAGTRSRLVLTPDLSHPHTEASQPPLAHRSAPLRSAPDHEADEPRISIPLSAYAETEGKRSALGRAGAVLLTLVLLCGAALFLLRGVTAWRQPGNAVQQAFASFSQSSASTYARLRDAIHGTPAASRSTVTTQPALPASDTVPVAPVEAAPAVASARSENSSPAAPAPGGTPLPATPSQSNATQGSRTTSRPRAEEAVNDYDPARDAALVQVPGSEMRSHLFASRFPIVPDAVNADAVSGVVTLHAVITARGTVEHIYAISGPSALRQPAIDAVSGWRYRPYLLNGSPIDVSTTIRVDFSGND